MTQFRDKWPDMRMKHLELIQNAITRMGTNSANFKGYCLTISAAVISLSAAVSKPEIIIYSIPLIFALSILDSVYLSLEKGFRNNYDQVRRSRIESEPDFEISPSYSHGIEAYFSWSAAGFYWSIIFLMFLLFVAMK